MFVLFVCLGDAFLVEFVAVHFSDSCFDGRLQIACRGRRGGGIFPVATFDYASMSCVFSSLYFVPTSDYYVTANSFSGVSRRSEDLFSLHNIVIDLDCHGLPFGLLDALDDLVWRLRHDFDDFDLPVPTSFVVTGRGVQLWWAFEGVSVKLKFFYDAVVDYLVEHIDVFLYSLDLLGEVSLFHVDAAASRNAIGYFRLPYTMNTMVGRLVTFETTGNFYNLMDLFETFCTGNTSLFRSSFEGVRNNDYSVGVAIKRGSPEFCLDSVLDGEKPVFSLSTYRLNGSNFSAQDHLSVLDVRLQALYSLRDLRNLPKGQEERNNFCFMVYNTLVSVYGHAAAYDQLLQFNSGFYQPMTEYELKTVISTAQKKGGYLYSTGKMCEFLGITEDESVKIGLSSSFDGALQGKVKKKAISLAKKNARNEEILRLYDAGYKNVTIAKELGISVPTVSKIVNASRHNHKENREELVLGYLKMGKTHVEIAKLCACSTKTVQRILLQNKNEPTV